MKYALRQMWNWEAFDLWSRFEIKKKMSPISGSIVDVVY